MMNLEQPQTEPERISVEALIDSFGPISRMPESTATEAVAKRDAYNDAIKQLNERLRTVHNETYDDSLDDDSQEETEDGRQRDIIGLAERQFRGELDRLHEVIMKLEDK